MLRTHTCGELNKEMVDQKATLCGWVHSRRNHGSVIFIDIRDRYGLTQVVFVRGINKEAFKVAKKFKMEDSISVTGTVVARQENAVNKEIPTGEVELCAENLEVFSKSQDLPFMIEDGIEANEENRLMYRFLDLRRPEMLNRMVVRHKAAQAARKYLNGESFLEVETPMLTKSTPEGARDFLVPSRLSLGECYALPQSPQLFKQMLMVSGIDRYYQVAKCFRDEDLRKDRQPEFTQVDMEISYATEEDIYTTLEGMLKVIFKDAVGYDLQIPFPRMTHAEAMEKYGSDKPDLEGDDPYRFLWVTDFPLFKYNDDEQRWDSEHHPFTSPKPEDMEKLESDPGSVLSSSFDLVLNGNELGSGSVRIHDGELQKKIFELLNISEEEAKAKFDFLLRAFEYGPPPHAGFAIGLDRLITILTEAESIREVIAFPKNQKGICNLTAAPSKVSPSQLDELGVRIVDEVEE